MWFTQVDKITFHDPLAAATIFEQAVCGFERGHVDVELSSERLAGLTYWTPDAQGQHEVALTVNPQRFFEHYFSFFLQ